MRRLVICLAVIGVCAAAAVMIGASGSTEPGTKYKIVFDNVFGLVSGGELRIGGVRAGVIRDFELTSGEPKKVAVEVEVTERGFDSLRTDAECGVRQQSLIGEYFIDCQFGSGRRLPDGGTVPVQQTTGTVPIDLVNNIMRRPYRERFRLIISELGTGLAGRPDELNEVIRRAHPGLREVNETIAILANQNQIIKDFIRDADRVSVAVEPRRFDVARWAQEASETAGIQASRRESLTAQWRRLPVFLGELRPTLARLEATVDRQIPLLRRLERAAPKLVRFFSALGPFARASRGANRQLGRTALAGTAAISESREEIAELRRLSVDAPRLARPLRQFLQTIDDRSRSIEHDPEAARTAPPRPDKTAYQEGRGFTGMEAFWNYIYWQTLATNAFDEVSHLLRIALLSIPACNPYSTKPTEAQIRRCASYTGPYQPGVNAPDPTRKGTAAAERRERAKGATAPDAPRGAGDPEAPPVAGQPDISQPQVVLPPGLQSLVDGLRQGGRRGGEAPGGDAGPPAQADQLLDFLMAP